MFGLGLVREWVAIMMKLLFLFELGSGVRVRVIVRFNFWLIVRYG